MTVNTTRKNEWDRENLRTVSCRLRKEEAEKFREFAELNGKTPNALVAGYVRRCVELGKDVEPELKDNNKRLREENAILRKKILLAQKEVDIARDRAARAEALVDAWLRSADER